MATKRMISKQIVDSDAFLNMPATTQNLYFHLNIRADDDGFVDSPKKIMRIVGASDDDMRILLSKRYLLTFESGIIVIKHWRLHNTIQKDRYKPTLYKEEFETLKIKENGAYTDTKCIQDVNKAETQIRLDKSRVDKDNNSDATDSESKEDPESRAAALAEKELFASVEEAFLSQLEDETQYSYPRERTHINKLIARVRNKASPADFLRQTIETFYRLHTGRDKFWKKQPFLPSVLNSSGIWPRVLEEAKTDYVDTGVELWN